MEWIGFQKQKEKVLAYPTKSRNEEKRKRKERNAKKGKQKQKPSKQEKGWRKMDGWTKVQKRVLYVIRNDPWSDYP